ncbi:MAG TPA: hypothetical protein GX396_05920 [Tissierellia bacterium]|nr:hypothetical protein [Tissierellia bacterium]
MEKKNNFMQLLMYSIKEKRNWALLSMVIILVTTLMIPYILRADEEIFIMFGIIELFILVLINCLVDNNFLHNEYKLAYYRSKPVTLRKQIIINIITNTLFTAFLLVLIIFSVVFHGTDYEILDIFKTLIPWLAAGILLASLSSILSGNTLMAGAMTIFNFCLPLIFFLVTMFIFSILENVVIGFNLNVLSDYFYNNIYRLDYLYFVIYSDKSIDFIYVLLLAVILIFISLLLHWCIKRRKNENTGFIVFDGYKYFVAVLSSLIIPAFFSVSTSQYISILSRIVISFSLAVLTYYIIIAFIEKSFRISKLSIKVFAVSMVLFSALTGGTVLVANQYKNMVPDPEDVKIAYIGNNSWAVNEVTRFLEDPSRNENMTLNELTRNYGIITFEEIENIESITELHREILNNQEIQGGDYYSSRCIIAYWMEDGSVLNRYYVLKANDSQEDSRAVEIKNEIAHKIINSSEYKRQKYYYLYDEEYYKGRSLYAKLGNNHNILEAFESVNLNDLRDILIIDLDDYIEENKDAFLELTTWYYDKYRGREGYYLEIYEKVSDKDSNYLDELFIDNFTNTLNYFK